MTILFFKKLNPLNTHEKMQAKNIITLIVTK